MHNSTALAAAVLALGVTAAVPLHRAVLTAASVAPGPVSAAHVPLRSSATGRCQAGHDATVAAWGARETWRTLAPYPVPRDARPTEAPGVWIERWQVGGDVELRRVEAESTVVVRVSESDCARDAQTFTRRFNADSLRNSFTDHTLATLVANDRRGMIYVWSPRMPLSVAGLVQAREAAAQLGMSFTAVVADANNDDLRTVNIDSRYARRMESLELVYRNATIHYPTVVMFDNGRVVDGAIPGFRNSNSYLLIARQLLAQNASTAISDETAKSPGATVNRGLVPDYWVDKNARVTNVSSVNTLRRIGFFFKPIAGTNLISYTAAEIAYLFDIVTGKEQTIPGHVDPVPTPDGRFITLPGLHFHPVPMLLAGKNAPVYTDGMLPDEYQTTSILSETKSTLRYRVVTGWRDGARFRDYNVALGKKGAIGAITPVAAPFVPCTGRQLTLPINAKAGREFGAFDVTARSNFVIEVDEKQQCVNKLDLGFASGKISFSYDGASIAFATSRIDTDATGDLIRPSESFYKDALLLYRKNGRVVSLSQNRPMRGLTFPEYRKDGAVMLLDQGGPTRPVEVIRVVTVK